MRSGQEEPGAQVLASVDAPELGSDLGLLLRNLADLKADRVYTPSSTREAWLLHAIDLFRTDFDRLTKPLPDVVRVSVGFPVGRRQVIGQCWATVGEGQKNFDIFVSPSLTSPTDVLGVLLHELCHVADGCEHGHGSQFGRLARPLGLVGPLTATTPGPKLRNDLNALADLLGPYPHRRLDRPSQEQKQTTRMLKVVCPHCGYLARTTRQWLDRKGAPLCPDGVLMQRA